MYVVQYVQCMYTICRNYNTYNIYNMYSTYNMYTIQNVLLDVVLSTEYLAPSTW